MTATEKPEPVGSTDPTRRVLSLVVGSVLAICSLGLVAMGGIALVAANSNAGYVDLGHADYSTDGYAVVTDPYDWSTGKYLLGRMGKVRVRVTPSGGSVPAFVGLARPEAVRGYLTGVEYATGRGAGNYRVTYTQHSGKAPASPPAPAGVWTAQTTGNGTLTLQFSARAQGGEQILVAMNADGSPSVGGHVETAATVPSLPWIGAVVLIGGVVLLTGSAVLIVRPLRRRSGRPGPTEL